MQIQKFKNLAKDAFKDLNKIQTGENKLVKTGYECIDTHIGGLLKGDIIIISAMSGHGKSELLFKMKENILNPELNEGSEDFVFLDNSLEMKVFNIILRTLDRNMEKSKKDLLLKEFTEEEKRQAKQCYKNLQDDRQFINQSPTTPKDFYKGTKEFLEQHKDKRACFISIDHILLVSGSDKKEVIDTTIEYINQLKLEFTNCYFIVLSQLNRSVLNRVAEKNNLAEPNTGDLYGSEFMNHSASYNIILFNAYKVGIEQYLKVNPSRYDYLEEHFGDMSSKGKASFNTQGKLFHTVVKVREGSAMHKDLFIEDMVLPEEELKKTPQKPNSDFEQPKFDEEDPF